MVVDGKSRLGISDEQLAAFCRKWRISRLEIFGSALREDFDPGKSDIDLLVTFGPGADWSLFDQLRMEEEFQGIIGRAVDMPTRASIGRMENWIRRKNILDSARTIFEVA